jgi:hypothetical protein
VSVVGFACCCDLCCLTIAKQIHQGNQGQESCLLFQRKFHSHLFVKMAFPGFKKEEDRRDMIAFLHRDAGGK